MAKQSSSEFRFRKTDTIGAAAAEEDGQFLEQCFVNTGEYDILKDIDDYRQIVLGRTGSGKSALFERLKTEAPDHVISLELQQLALTYVSNSSVIRYFSELGVNLDPFYKLLWRHILTVEILRKHRASHVHDESKGLWAYITERISSKRSKDRMARSAEQYLQDWDDKFWVELEYNVKGITRKMENDLTSNLSAELKASIASGCATHEITESLSEEQRIETIDRGQRVVSDAQVQDLSRAQRLLQSILTDPQQYYYVLIDRLDENWVDETVRYRLIMTLLEAVREITKVPYVKVLVAIRRDLLDRVFRVLREEGAGFQEEKYQSLYLPLRWSPEQLIRVLDKRVTALIVRRYEKRTTISHYDVLPKKVDSVAVDTFITDRAVRPRDIIKFFNECIEKADGRARIQVDSLKRAEGDYSRQRMRALGDEWYASYPGLLDFVDLLKKKPPTFPLERVDVKEIEDLCLQSEIDHPNSAGPLREGARAVAEAHGDPDSFKRTLFRVFYRVGLVGLKLETFQRASWIDEGGQDVSLSDINDGASVSVHPTYWRALGIDVRKRRR